MDKESIIRMARETGINEATSEFYGDELGRFFAMAYEAGATAEREAIIQMMPGGSCVDPQWVCDAIRARGQE